MDWDAAREREARRREAALPKRAKCPGCEAPVVKKGDLCMGCAWEKEHTGRAPVAPPAIKARRKKRVRYRPR